MPFTGNNSGYQVLCPVLEITVDMKRSCGAVLEITVDITRSRVLCSKCRR